MKVILAEDLAPEIEAMDTWWRDKCEKAPERFTEERVDARVMIETQPKSFPVDKTTRRGVVHRAPMPKTRNHVNEVLREAEDLIIIGGVWGTPRRSTPDLG